jgi:hypothetical protein
MLIAECPMKFITLLLLAVLILVPGASHAQQGQTWIAGFGMGSGVWRE